MHAVQACVHCGFCLAACPTYGELGQEMDTPRGRIVLMKGVLEGYGIRLEPLQLSVWAIPTAVAALLIHGTRLLLFDRATRKAAK